MNIALFIILITLVIAFVLGILARRGNQMKMEEWATGGRNFGILLVFLLAAGETYTTFTFLGGSGWAYSHGGPALYIPVYGSLGYVISYFIAPIIWKIAKKHKLVSQADFFTHRYGSRTVGVVTTIVGILSLIPYLILQLQGLGIL